MRTLLPILILIGIASTPMHAQQLIGDSDNSAPAVINYQPALPALKPASGNTETNDKATGTCTDQNEYPNDRFVGGSNFNFFLRNGGSLTALQFFPSFTGRVTGIFFDGLSPNVANNSVNLVVYTVDPFGDPGTRLANTSTTVGTNLAEYGSQFTSPINVTGGFFAGIEYNVQSMDTILVQTNSDGNGDFDNYAIYQNQFGNFESVLFDIGLDVDFLIKPEIEFNATANFTADENSVCDGDRVQFSNTSTLPNFFSSPYFNQVTGSVFQWDFDDGTPTVTQNSPNHQFNGDAGPYNVKMTALYDGFTRNCFITDSITIAQDSVPSAWFSYSSNKLNVTFVNRTRQGQTWDWDLGSGGSTSNLENPIFAYPAPGSYAVTLTSSNDCGEDVHATFIMVSDTADFTTVSIEERKNILSVDLFPNPTNDLINLDFGNSTTGQAQVTIMNVVGKVVEEHSLNLSSNLTYRIDMSNHAAGTYFVQVVTGDQRTSSKFVKR